MPNKFIENFFAKKLFDRLKIEPSSYEEEERPDCIFTLSGKQVGMEITTATPRDVFRAQILAQELASEDPSSTVVFSTTSLRTTEEIPKKSQIIKDMLNPANFSSEIGDSEKAFCDDLKMAWRKKRANLNKQQYQKFDQNWLLIWDHQRLSECEATFDILEPIMKRISFYERDSSLEPLEFDRIYVICDSFTIEFAEQNYRVWRDPDDV